MDIGTYATLRVVESRENGAYLKWGGVKDLFLPRDEQKGWVYEGEDIVVFITLDDDKSPMASMRLEEFLSSEQTTAIPDQKVDLLIFGESDLGIKAIVDNTHQGILYFNEVFQTLHYGQRIPGYIKKVRDDGKIDLILTPSGTKGSRDLGQRILEEVKAAGGFLAMTDKSQPEEIYDLFQVSKKKFKMALGGLFRQRKVTLHDDGVRLVEP